MGIRDDLYKDIDRLYQKKMGRIHFLKEKSLQAIREGHLPEDLNERTKDVIRWLIEDREMRLRRKRDIRVLFSDLRREREETRRDVDGLLEGFAREREETRANWQKVQAKVKEGKGLVDRYGKQIEIAAQSSGGSEVEAEPSGSSEEGQGAERRWQIGEEG